MKNINFGGRVKNMFGYGKKDEESATESEDQGGSRESRSTQEDITDDQLQVIQAAMNAKSAGHEGEAANPTDVRFFI